MISLWNGTVRTVDKSPPGKPSVARLMRADARLPAEIVPGNAGTIARRGVLATGATGFLGRFVVRELLKRPGIEIVCLVRAESTLEAHERLTYSLRLAGIAPDVHAGRLLVVAAAADQLRFGLNDSDYRLLADRVDHVYHCAADVNWARGYRQLRASNVTGTLEVIRFACTGHRKRVLYASTIAVCFATELPQTLDETTDMLPYIDNMPLPYAQTKCVSEALLRTASCRGLPVSIIRPALISGDSKTGIANPGDLISALIQGCIASGAAIDTDWRLDCVPVDHVAQVLVRLGEIERPNWELLNLFNERGRDWREVVLWMNLYGYPIQLLNHDEWLHLTFDRLSTRHSLFGYRRFFGATSARRCGPAPYETYLANRQSRVRNQQTLDILDELGIKAPELDAALLERYLEHYADAGLLPRAKREGNPRQKPTGSIDLLRQTMDKWLTSYNFRVHSVSEKCIGTHNGIFNEVASARVGGAVGIHRFDVWLGRNGSDRQQQLDVLLKTKPSDSVMQDLLVEVATLCDPQLGALCETFKHDLGLAGCHERELAIYQQAELRRFMPRSYGTSHNAAKGTWSIAMEYLDEAEVPCVTGARLSRSEINRVISGLASMHAVFYCREHDLRNMAWLDAPPAAERMQKMTPFWRALAEYSAPTFGLWLGEPVLGVQTSLIATFGDWWPELQSMPRTLVHNDCNPRNFVLHRTVSETIPMFFDWELATIDVPQRDVAELLCFVLPADCSHEDLAAWLEMHRRGLEEGSGIAIDKLECLRGFALSLRHLMINRLPLYTLMHRFRPQPFLPAVVRNCHKLYLLSHALALKPKWRASGTQVAAAPMPI